VRHQVGNLMVSLFPEEIAARQQKKAASATIATGQRV
jgi:hypothetical protein